MRWLVVRHAVDPKVTTVALQGRILPEWKPGSVMHVTRSCDKTAERSSLGGIGSSQAVESRSG
jgi:hypothetical protein